MGYFFKYMCYYSGQINQTDGKFDNIFSLLKDLNLFKQKQKEEVFTDLFLHTYSICSKEGSHRVYRKW